MDLKLLDTGFKLVVTLSEFLGQSLRQWLVVWALATAYGVKLGISGGQPFPGALDNTSPRLEGTESNQLYSSGLLPKSGPFSSVICT